MRYSPLLSVMLDCRQAAKLITARLDRPLSPFERVALGLHLKICTACPTVIRQLDMIRDAVHAWRDSVETTTEERLSPGTAR